MTHEHYIENLDDYLDGRLSPDDERAFEAAIATDATLRETVDEARAIRKALGGLPARLEPERDLWRGIEDDIRPSKSAVDFGRYRGRHARRPLLNYVLAAAAMLAMVLGVPFLIEDSGPPPSDQRKTAIAPTPSPDPALEAVQAQYASARDELRTVLEKRRDGLSPATLSIVDENLRVIAEAVEEIEAALAADPGSEQLERMLHAAYQSEVGLLRQAVVLADEDDLAAPEGGGDEA